MVYCIKRWAKGILKIPRSADLLFNIAGSLFGKDSKEQNAVYQGWKAVGILPREEGPDLRNVISEKRKMQEEIV